MSGRSFLLGLTAVLVGGAAIFFGLAKGIPEAAKIAAAATPVAAAGEQQIAGASFVPRQQGQAETFTLSPHDINGLTQVLVWVRNNFTIPEIWQALWDAGIRVCVLNPGGPKPPKGEPPVAVTPVPTVCISGCGNGKPGGDGP